MIQILIIEDNVAIQEALTLALNDSGYRVKCLTDGRQALLWLQSQQSSDLPQLILLDLMMPVMDGWEFQQQQQLDSRLNRIPVLLISADGRLHQKASQFGVVGYLKKPIQLDILLNVVKKYCT